MIESIASSMLGEETYCRDLNASFDRGEEAYRQLQNQISAEFKIQQSFLNQFYLEDQLSFKAGKRIFSFQKGSEVEKRIEHYRQSAFAFINQYLQVLETCPSRIKKALINEIFQKKIEGELYRFSYRFLHESFDELRKRIIQIALNRLSRPGVTDEDVFYIRAYPDEKVELGFFQSLENVKLPLFKDISFNEASVNEFDDFLLLNLAGETEEEVSTLEGEENILTEYRTYQSIYNYKRKIAPHSQYLYFESEAEEALFSLSSRIQGLNREIIGLLGENVQSYQLIPKGQIWIIRRHEGEMSIEEKKVVDSSLKQKMGAHRDSVVAYCFVHKRFGGEGFFSLPRFEEYLTVMSKDLAQVKLKISMKKIKKIAEDKLKNRELEEESYRQFSYSNGILKVFYKNGEGAPLSSFEERLNEEEKYFCDLHDIYRAIERKTTNFTL